MSAMGFGSNIFGTGTTLGDVVGTYEQTFGGATVAGPDAIGSDALGSIKTLFSGFSCSGLDGVGLCGLTVGVDHAFKLDVGTTGTGELFDFVHALEFNVSLAPASHMPEPAAAMVFGVGFMIVARRVRTSRQ